MWRTSTLTQCIPGTCEIKRTAQAILGSVSPLSGLLPGLVVGVLYKNTDIRTVQELLGHSDVSTAMIDAPMLKVAAGATASPLVALPLSARTLAAAMAHNWAVAQQDGGTH